MSAPLHVHIPEVERGIIDRLERMERLDQKVHFAKQACTFCLFGVESGRYMASPPKVWKFPDTFYGWSSADPQCRLPDTGDTDEIKDAIFAVIEDSLAHRARAIKACLEEYDIEIANFQADFANRALLANAHTTRPTEQVPMIMDNKIVRKVMRGTVQVKVTTTSVLGPYVETFSYFERKRIFQNGDDARDNRPAMYNRR